MDPRYEYLNRLTRRQFFQGAGLAMGGLALNYLAPRLRALQPNEISSRRSRHDRGFDSSIKRCQSPPVFRRQRQQIGVGDLRHSTDPPGIKQTPVADRNVVRPKDMVARGRGLCHSPHRIGYCQSSRVAGVSQDSHATVLGQWTGRPAYRSILIQPRVRVPMMDVCRIEQRDEAIHIQQRNHRATASSWSARTSSSVTVLSPAGITSNPAATFPRSRRLIVGTRLLFFPIRRPAAVEAGSSSSVLFMADTLPDKTLAASREF